jgi:hypothetical protein
VTELEAVNVILSVIGESPVESLADTALTQITEVALARRTLAEIKRDVAAEGWSWNTDYGITLTRTLSDDTFPLPADYLRCTFIEHNAAENDSYVIRGGRVYDRNKRTFTMPTVDAIKIDSAVVDLAFDDIPYAAQNYITIRAARTYGNRYINSSVIFSYTAQDEQYARIMMMRDEEISEQNNMLYGDQPAAIGYRPAMGRMYRSN